MSKLVDFWFANERLWFHSTEDDDQLIKESFEHLLTNHPAQDDRKQTYLSSKSKLSILEEIILYDQIVRHIYRGDKKKINSFGKIALALSLKIIENGWDELFQPEERCFILLPLRHTFQLEYVQMSLDIIQKYRQKVTNKYYDRFYKATLLSLSNIKTALIAPKPIDPTVLDQEIFSLLDERCNKNLSEVESVDPNEEVYQSIFKSIQKTMTNEITISLSGGVDSMVASFVLHHLPHIKVIAVSVNYNNRPQAKLEMEFVKRWCKLLGIPHYVQDITEIKRDRSDDRNLYEKVTKKMRFNIYKRFGNPVVLGHNQDDCVENIFSNIKKCRSYNNLRGMEEFVEDDGCLLVRPMLNISKAQIREFAEKYKIPHLPNSTPSWCERGRIREQLISFMEQFDRDLIPGFLKLANNVREMSQNEYDKIERIGDQIVITLPKEKRG